MHSFFCSSFFCMPHSAMLRCAVTHTDQNTSRPWLHEVAMEIRRLRGCREAFVLLNGCKGLQKKINNNNTWASPGGEQKEARSGFWILCCRVSPSSSCSLSVLLDTCMGNAGVGWRVVRCKTQTFLSLPLNNSFVFLTDKKRENAAAFVEPCISFHVICPLAMTVLS